MTSAKRLAGRLDVVANRKMNVPENSYLPLTQAFQKIQAWLVCDGVKRLAAMQPDFATMQHSVLPAQMKVVERPMQGPRVVRRGSRKSNPARTLLAIWPEDAISEYAMPIFCFVLGGQADIRVADYVLSCRVGDMIYFPSGVPKCNNARSHLEGDIQGRSCNLLWINAYIYPRGIKCYMCHSHAEKHLSPLTGEHGFSQNSFLQQLFVEICETIEKRQSEETLVRLLDLFMHLLQREIEEKTFLPAPDLIQTSQTSPHLPDSIHQACAYIDSHLQLKLTIEIVARQMFLSPSLFSKRFRHHTGMSFKTYLTRQRLERAAHLLTASDYTVEAIGQQIGLKGSQFRTLFQQHYGCSPVQFRQRQSNI